MNYQYRKTRKQYKKKLKPQTDCDFCNDPETLTKAVLKTKYAYVVPNRTFYDIWELHDVIDHLLVVPNRHVHSLSELDADEQADIMKILAEYEGKGYNVYGRARGSARKSVLHQHTHLIKIDNTKEPRLHFFLRKPWILIKF